MKILGRIKNKEIQVQRFFKQDLEKLEGKEVEIEVVGGGKTQQQLGYLFGVVYPIISGHTGFTKEEVHEVMKVRFSFYHKEHEGRIYKFTKGLSEMKKDEAGEFMTKIIN